MSVISAVAGIISLLLAMFFAFGTGITADKDSAEEARGPFLLSLVFAVFAILLLLVRA